MKFLLLKQCLTNVIYVIFTLRILPIRGVMILTVNEKKESCRVSLPLDRDTTAPPQAIVT